MATLPSSSNSPHRAAEATKRRGRVSRDAFSLTPETGADRVDITDYDFDGFFSAHGVANPLYD